MLVLVIGTRPFSVFRKEMIALGLWQAGGRNLGLKKIKSCESSSNSTQKMLTTIVQGPKLSCKIPVTLIWAKKVSMWCNWSRKVCYRDTYNIQILFRGKKLDGNSLPSEKKITWSMHAPFSNTGWWIWLSGRLQTVNIWGPGALGNHNLLARRLLHLIVKHTYLCFKYFMFYSYAFAYDLNAYFHSRFPWYLTLLTILRWLKCFNLA